MKKGLIILLILTFTFSLLFGCAKNTATTNSGYTFVDDLNRTVTVTSYDKTAVLLGSFADLWMLSGGSICAAADDAWEDFDLDLPKTVVNLGTTEKLSLEKLLAAEPDFVIASTKRKQHIEWEQTLRAAGITVAYFDVTDFDSYLNMLRICTDITGREDLYKINGLNLKNDIEETIKKSIRRCDETKPQSILLLRASATYIRAKKSDGTVLGEMLKDLNCINIADSEESLLENLSIESILEKNPDRIFIVQTGDDYDGMKKAIENMFNENPAWYELDAVKNGRVHFMDKKLYNFKPNAKWSKAYENLEKILSEE